MNRCFLSLSLFPFAARLKYAPHCAHGVEGEQKHCLADGPLGARKPTIGKESEQYFSMLMLQEGIMASAFVYSPSIYDGVTYTKLHL